MKRMIYESLMNNVSTVFGLSKEEILTPTKKRDVVDARQVIYYVCSKKNMRLAHIQSYLKQDGYSVTHSTIINGIKRVEAEMEFDHDYAKIINQLCTQ